MRETQVKSIMKFCFMLTRIHIIKMDDKGWSMQINATVFV